MRCLEEMIKVKRLARSKCEETKNTRLFHDLVA